MTRPPSFTNIVDAIDWYNHTGHARSHTYPPLNVVGEEMADSYNATIFAGLTRMEPVTRVLHLDQKIANNRDAVASLSKDPGPPDASRTAAIAVHSAIVDVLLIWRGQIDRALAEQLAPVM